MVPMRKMSLVLLFVLAATSCLAAPEDLPTLTSPDVLFDLGLTARDVALGSVGGVFSEDAGGVFGNPAALVNIGRSSFLFSQRSQSIGTGFQFANYAADLTSAAFSLNIRNGWGVLAGGIVDLSVDDIPQTDAGGFVPVGDSFSDKQTGLILSYAKPVDGDRASVGVSYRYLRHELANTNGDGHGFDVGLRYRFSQTWYGGVLVRDGTDVSWDDHEDLGVSVIKYSVSGRLYGGMDSPLWLMFSASQPSRRPARGAVGVEQRFLIDSSTIARGRYYLRASLGSAVLEERGFGQKEGLDFGQYAFGFGVVKPAVFMGADLVIDYAFRQGEYWDDSYFSIGVRVGR